MAESTSEFSLAISIVAPSAEAKSASFWKKSAALPSEDIAQSAQPPGTLGEMRKYAVAHLAELSKKFQHAIAGLPGVTVHFAHSSAEIVDVVAGLAEPKGVVAINKSGVVANELVRALQARYLNVIDTYAESARGAGNPVVFPHIQRFGLEETAESFANQAWTPDSKKGIQDCVALLGVSVAAAEDGSIYFLQHFTNISALLNEAKALVIVVPLDKILPTRAEARLQLFAMAAHGFVPVMMEINKRAQGAKPVLAGLRACDTREETPVHLFLWDNGRTNLAQSEGRDLLECISCRACTVHCPTQRYFGGPTHQSPREYALARLLGHSDNVDFCVLCNMCYVTCPVRINIPRHLADQKAADATDSGLSLQRALLGNPALIGRLATSVAPIANRALSFQPVRKLMQCCAGIASERPLPRFAEETFTAWFKKPREKSAHRLTRNVAFYAGCYANYNDPEIGRAFIRVLERNGVSVRFPDQHCCGIPQLANGRRQSAIATARFNLENLEKAVADGCDIVTTCTTCRFTLTKEYRDLLGEQAEPVASRTYDASEYLLAMHKAGDLDITSLSPLASRVFHHTPCHAKAAELTGVSPTLTRLIPGLDVSEVNRGCCGIAGTFGMKQQHYRRSMEIGAPVFDAIQQAGAGLVMTDCPTCALQLAYGTGREVVHPVVLLDRSYSYGRCDE